MCFALWDRHDPFRCGVEWNVMVLGAFGRRVDLWWLILSVGSLRLRCPLQISTVYIEVCPWDISRDNSVRKEGLRTWAAAPSPRLEAQKE